MRNNIQRREKKKCNQSSDLIAMWTATDMRRMPSPDPATTTISTRTRFLLKNWPTIRLEASRFRPTPTPAQSKKIFRIKLRRQWIQRHKKINSYWNKNIKWNQMISILKQLNLFFLFLSFIFSPSAGRLEFFCNHRWPHFSKKNLAVDHISWCNEQIFIVVIVHRK